MSASATINSYKSIAKKIGIITNNTDIPMPIIMDWIWDILRQAEKYAHNNGISVQEASKLFGSKGWASDYFDRCRREYESSNQCRRIAASNELCPQAETTKCYA